MTWCTSILSGSKAFFVMASMPFALSTGSKDIGITAPIALSDSLFVNSFASVAVVVFCAVFSEYALLTSVGAVD